MAALGERRKNAEDVGHPFGDDRLRRLAIGAGAQVLLDRELGKDLPSLGDAGDTGGDDPVGGEPGDVDAVEHDAPGPRRRQPEDRAHHGGLARAVRAEQAGDAFRLHRERNTMQDVGLLVAGAHVVDLEQVGHHATPR